MKVQEVECWIPDHLLTESEIDHLCIGLNRGGSWDWDLVANLWDPIDLIKYGFSENELMGTFEKVEEHKKEKKKKTTICPSCGHEF